MPRLAANIGLEVLIPAMYEYGKKRFPEDESESFSEMVGESYKDNGVLALDELIALLIYESEYSTKVKADLSKVEFDWENHQALEYKEHPYASWRQAKAGFWYYEMVAGGDWEQQIYMVIYWDGADIRGYIPKDGNSYDPKTNKARHNDVDDVELDLDKLRADVEKRIKVG